MSPTDCVLKMAEGAVLFSVELLYPPAISCCEDSPVHHYNVLERAGAEGKIKNAGTTNSDKSKQSGITRTRRAEADCKCLYRWINVFCGYISICGRTATIGPNVLLYFFYFVFWVENI